MNENYQNNLCTFHGKTTHSAVHNALSKSASKIGSDVNIQISRTGNIQGHHTMSPTCGLEWEWETEFEVKVQHFIVQLMHTMSKNVESLKRFQFRFTRKPTSGSHSQYLAKITHLVQYSFVHSFIYLRSVNPYKVSQPIRYRTCHNIKVSQSINNYIIYTFYSKSYKNTKVKASIPSLVHSVLYCIVLYLIY